MSDPNGKSLFWQLAATAFLSVAGSAGSTAFITYAHVTRHDVQIEDHERRISATEIQLNRNSSAIASLQSREDALEKVDQHIDEELARIEGKIDRVIELRALR